MSGFNKRFPQFEGKVVGLYDGWRPLPSPNYPSQEELMAGPTALVSTINGPVVQSIDGSGSVITRPATLKDIHIDAFWR